MRILIFISNMPWTLVGIIGAMLSGVHKVRFVRKPPALIFYVRSFWWYKWLPGKKRVRAITNGHTIQLGPLELPQDLEHELVHVEQAEREPFIHPLRYLMESRKQGYRRNKYEVEAYARARNEYTDLKVKNRS